jgi:O-methyltransferase
MLAAISGAESVLELGTFTGYSALSLAEGVVKGKKEKMRKRDISEEKVEGKKNNERKEKEIEGEKVDVKIEIVTEESNGKIENLDLNLESEIDRISENENLDDTETSVFSARKFKKLQKRKQIVEKIENNKQKIENEKLEKLEKLNQTSSEFDVVVSLEEKRERRGCVVTCEMDPSAAKIASEFFQMSDLGEEVTHILNLKDFRFILFVLEIFIFHSYSNIEGCVSQS